MALCGNKAKGCGGCSMLDIPYAQQLAHKQAHVEALLAPCRPQTVFPVLGMENPMHYRCKAEATFTTGPDGKLCCGLYKSGTHRVVPAENCLLQHEAATQAIDAVCRAAQECRYTAFDEDRGTGLLRHVLVRFGLYTGQLLVVIVTASPFLPGSRRFTARLRALCPQLTTLVQSVNSRRTTFVLGKEEKILYGKGVIEDRLCGCTFQISPASFYQVNPAQAQILYRRAIEMAGFTGQERMVDAYCGTGTIALAAAHSAASVTGAELNAGAVRDAAANARRNKIKNARFVQADAGRFLAQCIEQKERPDVVFLDPPRSGASPEFLQTLCRLQPARVVYISCGPDTLARDAAFLCKNGFFLSAVQAVDLFPFTEHVETVVLMSRVQN